MATQRHRDGLGPEADAEHGHAGVERELQHRHLTVDPGADQVVVVDPGNGAHRGDQVVRARVRKGDLAVRGARLHDLHDVDAVPTLGQVPAQQAGRAIGLVLDDERSHDRRSGSGRRAEVGLGNQRVGAHRGGRAFGQDAAFVEHHDVVADASDEPEVVVDHQHSGAHSCGHRAN